jgi:NADP-dependent 3-hydroxy acid dehydrogenase YdfG
VNSFSGGVAVITGAGAGLARHAATLEMADVLADVDAEAVAALREEICAARGSAIDVVCDVRDPAAVGRMCLPRRVLRDLRLVDDRQVTVAYRIDDRLAQR